LLGAPRGFSPLTRGTRVASLVASRRDPGAARGTLTFFTFPSGADRRAARGRSDSMRTQHNLRQVDYTAQNSATSARTHARTLCFAPRRRTAFLFRPLPPPPNMPLTLCATEPHFSIAADIVTSCCKNALGRQKNLCNMHWGWAFSPLSTFSISQTLSYLGNSAYCVTCL